MSAKQWETAHFFQTNRGFAIIRVQPLRHKLVSTAFLKTVYKNIFLVFRLFQQLSRQLLILTWPSLCRS